MEPVADCRKVDFPAVHRPCDMTAVEVSRVVDPAVTRVNQGIIVRRIHLALDSDAMRFQGVEQRSDSLGNASQRVGGLNRLFGPDHFFLAFTATLSDLLADLA